MRLRISIDGTVVWLLIIIAVSSTARTTHGWCSRSLATTRQCLSSLAATTAGDGKSRRQQPSRPQFQQPQHSSSSNKRVSKFAQPALTAAEPTTTTPASTEKPKKMNKFGADSRIASLHKERLQTAGREGTKRYRNPNKVFLGNLDYTVTSEDLEEWLSQQFSMPAPLLIKQCKVIQDWKTQQSKGYGFCVFSDPLYATVCLEKCNNMELKGRKLRVSPGFKKQPDPAIYLQKKQQKIKDREEAAIRLGLDEAAGIVQPQKQQPPPMDPVAAQMLRRLDPDLLDDYSEDAAAGNYEMVDSMFDEDFMDDDSDDFRLDDGVWVGDENDEDIPAVDENGIVMNREKRRESSRKRKKKKISNKGFG